MNIKKLITDFKEKLNSPSARESKNSQLVLYIIIIVMINIVSTTLNFRIDITKNNTYSLSGKSIELVSNLKEKLKIKVLFSQDLPAEHSRIFRYLKDILEEYDYYGNKYFQYTIVKEEDLKDTAKDFGIRPVTSREFANDQIKMRQTYMGLVVQYADAMEKIDAVVSPEGLEYKITSLIGKISGKVNGLLNLKTPINVKLYLDKRILQLPIQGIENLDETVKVAFEKANESNYKKLNFNLIEKTTTEDGRTYGMNILKWKGSKSKSGAIVKSGEGILGIIVETGNKFEKIELNISPSLFGNYVISGAQGLEDKINNAVASILTTSKKICYMTSHGTVNIKDKESREGGGLFKTLLEDTYDIIELDLEKNEIPTDISTLIINGPQKPFSEKDLYKIDQYLMSGRSLMVFMDSYKEINPGGQNRFQRQQPIVIPLTTGLGKLLKHYGITPGKNIVLDKNCGKINQQNMIVDFPLLPYIKKSGLSRDNIITKYLNSAVLLKVSSIEYDMEKIKKNGGEVTELISSSDESWLMEGRISFNPNMINAPSDEKSFKKHPISLLLSGKLVSYFKGKEIPVDESKEKKTEKKSEKIKNIAKLDETIKSGKSQIALLTTSEITKSGIIAYTRKMAGGNGGEQKNSNDHLLHGYIDYFAGNIFIPEMKNKNISHNPIEKTSDNTRLVLKTINIAGVPIIVILLGFVFMTLRNKRKAIIENQFKGEIS